MSPLEAGGTSDRSNGNGSLMRILPMAFYQDVWKFSQLIDRVHQVSRITHAHPRSQIACGLYISIALCLLQGDDLNTAIAAGCDRLRGFYHSSPFAAELPHFQRLLDGKLATAPEAAISSSGYVVHTLEASLWCLLNTDSYAAAVLKAVNLGDDTDTTAAVTGGLAGLYYRIEQIPSEWVETIARKTDIEALAVRLHQATARLGKCH